MSWFGNNEKDNLYDEMRDFLKNHLVSELLEIVHAAVEHEEQK